MERAGDTLDDRVEYHTKEIARLRAQRERSATVVTSLREAISGVDNVLRQELDTADERPKKEADDSETVTRPRQTSKRSARTGSDRPTTTERAES
jgi:hypothetical protein